MDYDIRNKFSEAFKYSDPPCVPMPPSQFIERLKEAVQFLFREERNRGYLSNRRMYIECLDSYLKDKGIQEVIPDEDFFKTLAVEFSKTEIPRREIETTKFYNPAPRTSRRIVGTIRFLINCYFFPHNMTRRLLVKLDTKRSAREYSNLAKPCEPFLADKFIEDLHEANRSLAANEGTFRIRKTHILIFKEYLQNNGITSVAPDETFLLKCMEDFAAHPPRARVKGREGSSFYSPIVKTKAVREIRILVNRYFLPQKLTNRPILLEVERQRYERFFRLTKNTQQAISWFEEHGRVIKAIPVYREGDDNLGTSDTIRYIYRVTEKPLKPATTVGKINHVLNFLEIVGKKGVEEVNESDLKKFIEHCDRHKIVQKQDYLAHLATFFINAQAEGFVSDHPFKKVSLKMRGSNVRVDFIPKEGIEVLSDFNRLKLENPVEVRNALACALAYDAGLRAGELYGLDVANIGTDTDGDIYVSLDEKIQKGSKPKTILYLIFEGTKAILKYYLERTRPSLHPKDNALFISIHDKRRLNKATLENQMRAYMKGKGVKTFYKKSATGHHLRHSLATLNIQPLGPFSLYEIVERLRHSSYETAKKHYIHNNPYLQKQKFEAFKSRMKGKTQREFLREIPLSEMEAFLIEDVRLEPEIMSIVRKRFRAYKSENTSLQKEDKKDIIPNASLEKSGEREVLSAEVVRKRIEPLGLYFKTFSRYCRDKGLQVRKGRDVYFDERFIDELTTEWTRKEDVMDALGLSRTRFYELLEEKKWPVIKIGAILLVKLKRLVQGTKNRVLL